MVMSRWVLVSCTSRSVRTWFDKGWRQGAHFGYKGTFGPKTWPMELNDPKSELRSEYRRLLFEVGYWMGQCYRAEVDADYQTATGYDGYYDRAMHRRLLKVSTWYFMRIREKWN